jgi:hypothetical protein
MATERIISRTMLVTPDRAKQLASQFFATSKVNSALVHAYADDMRNGRWLLNGASMVLSPDGEVLDGRARILACIEAGTPFETLVVEGVDSVAFETMDALRKRTLADVLTIRQIQHGRALAASLRIIWGYRTRALPNLRQPSSMTLLGLVEDHPEIRDSILPSLRTAPLLPHGSGLALHYLFGLANPAKCDAFFAEFSNEALSDLHSPIGQLRRLLQDLRGKGGNRKQAYVLAVCVKAWNAFSVGKPLKLLRYAPEREPFPEIRGLREPDTPLFEHRPNAERGREASSRESKLTAQVEEITPELAERLLEANSLNRRISGPVVERYARDMKAGRWSLNGQTIKISSHGRLLDGQHRLEAVKKARTPFKAIVVRGIPEAHFGSLDVGRKRALGDILRDRGEINTASLASGLRWLWMLRHEVVLAANSSPTNSEMLELLSQHPEVRDSLKATAQVNPLMGSGMACALHFAFSEKSPSEASEFFARLADGLELTATSPIYHLRERLLKICSSYRLRMAEAERVALAIKAWNAFRTGKPMQQLSWRNRGTTRELLPTAA